VKYGGAETGDDEKYTAMMGMEVAIYDSGGNAAGAGR